VAAEGSQFDTHQFDSKMDELGRRRHDKDGWVRGGGRGEDEGRGDASWVKGRILTIAARPFSIFNGSTTMKAQKQDKTNFIYPFSTQPRNKTERCSAQSGYRRYDVKSKRLDVSLNVF
nr:hypothetical protein [Tanacetum cinerariifolium]